MQVQMELNDSEGKAPSSSGYKLVPWLNWDEWNDVRRSIFSSSPILISSALEKILAWECRGRLPIAVDLTAMIIEIHQKDPLYKDDSIDGSLDSERMINMLYCMFIMRLVNDFVEPTHKRTGRSISELAGAIGIPRTLVDIRHESSHRGLPSLKLVRMASLKALEWLKANYWEPQRNAIHNHRRQLKSKFRQMILCLRSNQVSKLNKKCRKRATFLVSCHKLSHLSQRMLTSKSEVSAVHVSKLTKRAAHIYALYPSEAVSWLLEIFISQASDQVSEELGMAKSQDADSLTDLKTIITKLCKRKPRLLLHLLKAVLETVEKKATSRNFERDGNHFFDAQNKGEKNQDYHLRSLVFHLIKILKVLKDSGLLQLVDEPRVSLTNDVVAPKSLISNFLRKCLPLLASGDEHMLSSVLLLSEMSGNVLLAEKLGKFLLLTSQSHEHDLYPIYNESLLLKEEDFIKKAAERLNHLKVRLLKRKSGYSRHASDESDAVKSRWTVAKMWPACPIGMLPCSFSSAAFHPVLDAVKDEIERDESEKNAENACAYEEKNAQNAENACSYEEKNAQISEIACAYEDNNIVCDYAEELPAMEKVFPMQGMLLVDGAWKKVNEEEMACIEDKIRLFV